MSHKEKASKFYDTAVILNYFYNFLTTNLSKFSIFHLKHKAYTFLPVPYLQKILENRCTSKSEFIHRILMNTWMEGGQTYTAVSKNKKTNKQKKQDMF